MTHAEQEAVRVQRGAGVLMFTLAEAPLVACGKSCLDLFARRERGELAELPPVEVPEKYKRAFQAERMSEVLGTARAKGLR